MSLNDERFLLHAAVPGTPRLYVIGCFERRVTIHDQQTRALNLVYALRSTGMVTDGDSVAIIGGGVAGLTAACGLLHFDYPVVVLERAPELIHLQRGSTLRWIHPHIFDWPSQDWDNDVAAIPFLRWQAGPASDVVVEQLLKRWETIAHSAQGSLRIVRSAYQMEMGEDALGESRGLKWNSLTDGSGAERFAAVILAVGFGEEPQREGQVGYWRDDSLHSINARARTTFVSGVGDSGVTDVLRLRIKDFRHDKFVTRIVSDELYDDGALKDELEQIESDHRVGDAAWLTEQYNKVISQDLDKFLKSELRIDTKVTLIHKDSGPISSKASMLSRFLLSRLIRIDTGLTVRHGEYLEDERTNNCVKVRWKDFQENVEKEQKHPRHQKQKHPRQKHPRHRPSGARCAKQGNCIEKAVTV